MVTKNSGRAGGFDEKLTAAEKCKVPILVTKGQRKRDFPRMSFLNFAGG